MRSYAAATLSQSDRLAREASLRDREKKQRIEDELALKETKDVLSKLGKNIENLENMDKAERENVIKVSKKDSSSCNFLFSVCKCSKLQTSLS